MIASSISAGQTKKCLNVLVSLLNLEVYVMMMMNKILKFRWMIFV